MSSYTLRASRRSPALHKLMMSSEPEALLASPPCSRKPLPHTCAASTHYHMSGFPFHGLNNLVPGCILCRIMCNSFYLNARCRGRCHGHAKLGHNKAFAIQRHKSQEDMSISTAQHSTAQHSTARHSTAQHSTAQHSPPWHSTAQHSTAYNGRAHQELAAATTIPGAGAETHQ